MSHYESVFILKPALSEDQVKDAIKKYEKFLKDNGCKIVDVENWGLKKLAYSIQKKLSGFYALIDFEYDSDLNVTLDKDANNWAVKRRDKLKKQKA